MRSNKSQISLEYLLSIALLMIFLVPLLYFSFSTFSSTSKVYSAQILVSRLVEISDDVYAHGWPSQQVVSLTFPESITNVTISNKTIAFQVEFRDSNTTVMGLTEGCIIGDLPLSKGLKTLLIKAEKNTCVNITEKV